MSDATPSGPVPPPETVKRFRSPPYPSIPISRAIERAKQVYGKALHHAVGGHVIGESWGLGIKSSGLWGTVGSLLQYGLLLDQGTGDKRKFQLTDAAIRITRDADPDSPKRRDAIQQAALKPPIFRELWDLFGPAQVADAVLKNHLVLDRQETGKAPFSDSAAAEVIKAYRETVAYAGLTDSDSVSTPEEDIAPRFVEQEPDRSTPMERAAPVSTAPATPPSLAAGEFAGNDTYQVMVYADRIRVTADVDLVGAKRLVKRLQRRIELLEEEAEEATS